MNCPKCESSNTEAVLADPIKCTHCSEIVYVEYNTCLGCGCLFKSVGDEIDMESIIEDADDISDVLLNMFSGISSEISGEVMNEERFKEFMNKVDNESVTELVWTDDSMSGLVHRCLRCQSLAYEVADSHFKCSNCDFSWGIRQGD